ncbi:MAG: type III pantothenate kinase [Rikenellaceae bacterium]|nr:type III pantothenate kinase [Rikenellaceae bacterium]
MNLAIDIGNSSAKMAVIEHGQVVDTFRTDRPDSAYIDSVLDHYPSVQAAILSSARGVHPGLEAGLRRRVGRYIRFDHTVPVPIKNRYETPETLGADRLAAAVGAAGAYPGRNVLIVDFGTAITIDMVSAAGEFLGGNISPGVGTRFRSLHDYTQQLPLRGLTEETTLLGRNSFSAIESGVIRGVIYEIEGYIAELSREYPDLNIIFTGGDGNFFARHVKNPIFATHELVLYGLNRILEYNAD